MMALGSSCHDPKGATKANFKSAIQTALDKRPSCLSIALPAEPRGMLDGRPKADPQLDAPVAAGLATKNLVMMQNSGWTLNGGPKQIQGTHYDFSAEGRKYAAHPEHSGLMINTATLCYGTPEVIEIVRYSEPGNLMGQTMTNVVYNTALKSVPSWAKDKELSDQFPELRKLPTQDHPQESHIDLVLMNDGWRVASSLF